MRIGSDREVRHGGVATAAAFLLFLGAGNAVLALTVTPSPTATPARCAGDCQGVGRVGVNDLVRCVNLALELPASCDACDGNRDGMVSVSELVTAVRAALLGCSGDPFEPDNSASQAKPLACGEFQIHDLAQAFDEDWVVFDIPDGSGGVLQTEYVGDGYIDTTLELFSDEGDSIAYNDDYNGLFSRVDACPPSGGARYYARVENLGSDPAQRYGLRLSCQPCPTPTPTPGPDGFEPDDSFAQASEIGCGEIQRRTASAFDHDWISFAIDTRSTVHLIRRGDVYTSELYDETGMLIDTPSFFDERYECGRNALVPGVYTLEVESYYGQLVPYEIGVFCSPCDVDNPAPTPTPTFPPTPTPFPPDEWEPDGREAAVPVDCSEGLIRTIAPFGDSDWLMFQLTERTAVLIDTYSWFGSPQLALQNEFGRDIEYGYSSIERPCGAGSLEAGTYLVESYSEYDSFPYDIWITCEPCDAMESATATVPTRTPTPTPLPLDPFEPDNDAEHAGTIECGDLQVHSFHTSRDEDWVTFELEEASALQILAGGDTYIEVFGSDSYFSSYGFLDVNCSSFSRGAPPGRYSVRTTSYQSIESYNLAVLCQPCAARGEGG